MAFPVPRDPQIELRGLGQDRLLRKAIRTVRLADHRLAFEMIIQPGIQNPLAQRLLQIVEQAIPGESILRITPCQKLIQYISFLIAIAPSIGGSMAQSTRCTTVPRNALRSE
jgi:hypothetical protein